MPAARARALAWIVLLVLAAVAGAGAETLVVEMTLKDGRLPEEGRLVRVRQGDEVTLRWTADRPLTVHVHGYDLEAKVSPGAPVVVRFAARATGRFAIEVHGPGREERTVGYLEVHPR